jgi:hypothetical protein
MDGSIAGFVRELLRTTPGPQKSVQLELDTEDIHGIFEALLMIMTELLKTWYAPPISIGTISEEHLALMIGYYASFGFGFDLHVDDTPLVLRINNKMYLQQTRLDAMKFQMAHAGKLYTVRFLVL